MTQQNTRSAGTEARKDVKQAAEGLAADAKDTAQDLQKRARNEAYSQADRAKEGVASEVSGLAHALRTAADDLREGSPQQRTFAQLADGLADASDAISGRDIGQLASDASGFARRNPIAFLGGAALAGFAISRFAKATARGDRHDDPTQGATSYGSRAGMDSDYPSRAAATAPGMQAPGETAPSSATPVGSPPGATTPGGTGASMSGSTGTTRSTGTGTAPGSTQGKTQGGR